MDECGINGIVQKESAITGALNDGGHMQGAIEKEGSLIGKVGIPKCLCTADYEELENKPSINGVTLDGNKTTEDLGIEAGVSSWNGQTGNVTFSETDPTVPSWAKQPTKPTYTAAEVGAFPYEDLGSFDIEEYDWDIWTYLENMTESGFFKAFEEQDGFDYFFRVERAGDSVYQELWSSEENSTIRYARSGYFDGTEWNFNPTVTWATNQSVEDRFNGYYTDAQVDDILDNNYYTKDVIDDMFAQFDPTVTNMTPINWADLVELRDNGELVPGTYYRIIDYEFISTKTSVVSAGHQFDIVVLAVSESMVSETADAVRNADDDYFEREVTVGGVEWLYTLYVDDMGENYGDEPIDHADDLHMADIFCDYGYLEHPDTGEMVPVLYKTNSEEYTFDEPDYDDIYFYEGVYDFDGDDFDMWSKWEHSEGSSGELVFMQQYALTNVIVEDNEFSVSPIPETKTVPVNMNAWELKYCLDNDKELFDWATTEGKGVIYYMKDEFGNEAPYDFKNALLKRYRITSANNYAPISSAFVGYNEGMQNNYYTTIDSSQYKLYYTFEMPGNTGSPQDGSLFGDCSYNTIEPYISEGKRVVNDIVFSGSNNKADFGCTSLTLIDSHNNRFDTGCTLLLLKYSRYNTFGSLARRITALQFGNSLVGSNAQNIVSGSIDCEIGRGCNSLALGNGNNGIKLGVGCNNITLGTWCYGLEFDTGCSNITTSNYCSYIVFGRQCLGITINSNYVRYVIFEPYVRSVTINASGSGSVNSYAQFLHFMMGVANYTATPGRNTQYKTTYQKTGSVTINA